MLAFPLDFVSSRGIRVPESVMPIGKSVRPVITCIIPEDQPRPSLTMAGGLGLRYKARHPELLVDSDYTTTGRLFPLLRLYHGPGDSDCQNFPFKESLSMEAIFELSNFDLRQFAGSQQNRALVFILLDALAAVLNKYGKLVITRQSCHTVQVRLAIGDAFIFVDFAAYQLDGFNPNRYFLWH